METSCSSNHKIIIFSANLSNFNKFNDIRFCVALYLWQISLFQWIWKYQLQIDKKCQKRILHSNGKGKNRMFTHDDTCGPVSEWTITDICVTSNPADISSTPVDLSRMIVKNILKCGSCIQHVTATCVKYTFRNTGGPAIKKITNRNYEKNIYKNSKLVLIVNPRPTIFKST